MQQAMERAPKLHGLWRRLFEHGAIGAAPGEMVYQ
jgi:hypothetical protein